MIQYNLCDLKGKITQINVNTIVLEY